MARKNKSLAGAFDQFDETKNKKDKQEQQITSEKVTPKQEQDNNNEIRNSNTNTVTKDVILDSNTESITQKTSDNPNVNSNTSTLDVEVAATVDNPVKQGGKNKGRSSNEVVSPDESPFSEEAGKTIRDVSANIMSMYDQKSKKKTVEETHSRSTFLFRKDLQERLNKLAKDKHGFKTMFMNNAIEALLDEMEAMQKKK